MQKLSSRDPNKRGPWDLVGRLGVGGMGVVYLATQNSETVALKVIRTDYLDDIAYRNRFQREVET